MSVPLQLKRAGAWGACPDGLQVFGGTSLQLHRDGQWETCEDPTPDKTWHCMEPGGRTGTTTGPSAGIVVLDGKNRILHAMRIRLPDMGAPMFLQIWRVSDATLLQQTPATTTNTDGRYEFPLTTPIALTTGEEFRLHVRAAPGAGSSIGQSRFIDAQSIDDVVLAATSTSTIRNTSADTMPNTFGTRTSRVCLELE